MKGLDSAKGKSGGKSKSGGGVVLTKKEKGESVSLQLGPSLILEQFGKKVVHGSNDPV